MTKLAKSSIFMRRQAGKTITVGKSPNRLAVGNVVIK